MYEMSNEQFADLLKQTAEQHGCKVVEIDFERHNINIDGPEEAVAACADALSKIFKTSETVGDDTV
jgi:ribosome maturation factor RimP